MKGTKVHFIFLIVFILTVFSCKINQDANIRSQISDKEILRFVTNMEKTIDILGVTLENIERQLKEHTEKIERLEKQIEYLESLQGMP
jgi:archaellum component FlaC